MIESLSCPQYTHQVKALCKSLVCSQRHLQEISGGIHLLLSAMERDLAKFNPNAGCSRVACGPGCGTCCVLNVEVLLPEALAISWFLRRRLTTAERSNLKERLRQLHIKTRWLDDEERLFVREQCVFLDHNGSCTIHAVRPLMCRSITSTDPAACREALSMIALDGEPRIEMDLFQKQLVDAVYLGLVEALKDSGLDHRPRRLTSAVLGLLSDPEKLDLKREGWLN